MARDHDIALLGATGFVGKLTARYLAEHGGGARIALAGRSPERLAAVRDDLGPAAKDWPLLSADTSDAHSLRRLAESTQVIVTTVGPYTRYGLPVVRACAAAGTDYADLTGEPMFVRTSIDDSHKQAVDTGARIVHSCGFDSIPSDITVWALHRAVQADGEGELGTTDFVLRGASGGLSGGTAASATEMLRTASTDADARRTAADPYTLSPDRGAEPEFGAQPDLKTRRGADIAPELAGLWTAGFFMAPFNTRIVRRSNALLDYAYGRDFTYSETMSVGKSVAAPVFATALTGVLAGAFGLGSRYFAKLPAPLVERLTPSSGSGPSQRTRERGWYRAQTYTTTSTGARYVANIAQRGDPGYQATALLLGESGLALAKDRDRLSDLHGVLTPAAAMGDALLRRLPAAGVTLEVERLA